MFEIFKHNAWQFLIAVDQLVNNLLGLIFFYKIWADETLSSHSWRLYENADSFIKKLPKIVIDGLFYFFEKDHCYNSYLSERNDRHKAPELRN